MKNYYCGFGKDIVRPLWRKEEGNLGMTLK